MLLLFQGSQAPPPGDRRDLPAGVTDAASGGVYLDVGSDSGVAVGDRGELLRDSVKVADVEVRHVSATSCFATVAAADPKFQARPGDRVTLRGVAPPDPAAGAGGGAKAPGQEKPFTPLLAPAQPQAETQHGPIVHGSVGASTSWVRDDKSDRSFLYHRVYTQGSVERLFDEPWSLEWALDLSTRSGNGYDGDPEQDRWRLRADEFVLRRHFEEGSVLGLGRIEPLALPSLGRIDGAYGEKVAGEGVRLGAIAGLRPDFEDLAFTTREPIVAGYGLYDTGSGGDTRLTASAGLLSTWFEGASDEQALLADLYVRSKRGHWLRASTQVDWYSGSEASRSGVGLTRLNAYGDLHLSDLFDLRATWSQYERPDTDSQRHDAPDDRLYGRGTRRAALALVETWRSGLAFEEEVGQVAGSGSDEQWQGIVRARDSSLFGIASLSADAAIFNLVGVDTRGLGTSLGVQWAGAGGLFVRLGYDAATTEIDGSDPFVSHTVSLWTSYDVTATTSFWLRVARSFGDELGAWTGDVGFTWRF